MSAIKELIERSNMFDEDIRETRIKMSHIAHDNKTDAIIVFTTQQDNFFMDTENWILENKWKNKWSDLTGVKRLNNIEWMYLICEYMDCPLNDFTTYEKWVNQGNGDEWFQD
jgi:hypothetical protein